MSFNKKYPKSKDARKRMKPYYDSRAFDHTCRNHGSCSWCKGNRTHKDKRQAEKSGEANFED